MAAVLPLRVRNAAIRGYSACRHDAGLGIDEYKKDKIEKEREIER
jgi:hypothetical protein